MSEQKMDTLAPDWQVSQWFNCQHPLSLNHLRGKIVVLHAFQMLCPGCVSHGVPLAERIHRLLAGDDLAVIGLHTVFEHHAAMTPVSLEAFLHEYQITHPIGVDTHMSDSTTPVTMRRFGLQGTPSLIVIDRQGIIRLHEFGKVDELLLGSVLGKLMESTGEV